MLAATMTASVMPAMANAESEAEIKDSAVKNVELLPFVNELMKHEPDNDKTFSRIIWLRALLFQAASSSLRLNLSALFPAQA